MILTASLSVHQVVWLGVLPQAAFSSSFLKGDNTEDPCSHSMPSSLSRFWRMRIRLCNSSRYDFVCPALPPYRTVGQRQDNCNGHSFGKRRNRRPQVDTSSLSTHVEDPPASTPVRPWFCSPSGAAPSIVFHDHWLCLGERIPLLYLEQE